MTKTWLRLIALTALGVFTALAAENQPKDVAFAADARVFPHVALGGVWSSEMTLVNLDPDDEAAFTLSFYQTDGSPWVLTIPGLGTNSEFDIILPPEGSAVYKPDSPGVQIETGWAIIDQPVDAQVAGHIIFTDGTANRPPFEAVVPLSSNSEFYLSIPFDNTENSVSCIAIANPTTGQLFYSLEFSNNDDELIDIFTSGSLSSLNQTSFCLPDEFPETADERGLIRITSASNFLSVLGFRFNTSGAFATMFPMTSERPADQEDTCFDLVQGDVPWNQSGNTSWDANNVERLCAGTSDPDATIACFSRGIEEHNEWRRAILECTYVNPTKLEADCFELVQNRVAWNQSGSTNWNDTNVQTLCNDTPNPLATIACFKRGIATHNVWQTASADCRGL